jgi:RNA polymerase sigma factor (TIGR02999 family)
MAEQKPPSVTQLLRAWRQGDMRAADDLLPLVYDRLRSLARRYLSSERPGHTLQTTALVHEAYVQLVDADIAWEDRRHFFAVAARAMRWILVDHARARKSAKRGGAVEDLRLDESCIITPEPAPYLVDLDRALTQLSEQDERKGQIVEMHFFGGLTFEELSRVFDVSLSTIEREMRLARAYLRKELHTRPDAS